MRVLLLLSLTAIGTPALAQTDAMPDRTQGIALIENAVRASLKDPDSAKFDWPNEFTDGWYRIPFSKKVTGWITCGTVNAKNGYGGYTGPAPVIAAIQNGAVVGLNIDPPGSSVVSSICAKVGVPVG